MCPAVCIIQCFLLYMGMKAGLCACKYLHVSVALLQFFMRYAGVHVYVVHLVFVGFPLLHCGLEAAVGPEVKSVKRQPFGPMGGRRDLYLSSAANPLRRQHFPRIH